jgi:alkylation response protein AidB-like acyl-CoA dehydrogenase
MSAIPALKSIPCQPLELVQVARRLGEQFSTRAAQFDDSDEFVGENYTALREAGLIEAGVPRELGGGGHDISVLSAMLRELARHCSSTALAFSMHTHQVAVPAWRWVHHKAASVEALLTRIANERIILLSSGGSDWIASSGLAEKVGGGFRIAARKVFSSGAPIGSLLMTSAVWEGDGCGPQVLHFGIPMNSPHIRIIPVWKAMGMRGTGSHDIVIDGYMVPDDGVTLKRKAGEWHPFFQIMATMAFPLIYAVYLGIAESARDVAVKMAKKRRPDSHVTTLVGRMDTELRGAQMAHRSMVEAALGKEPGAESVNEVMIGRTLVARHAIATVEIAMEAAGGAAFYRAAGLERRFRDIQGARYHPLQSGPQADYTGSIALGLPIDRVF